MKTEKFIKNLVLLLTVCLLTGAVVPAHAAAGTLGDINVKANKTAWLEMAKEYERMAGKINSVDNLLCDLSNPDVTKSEAALATAEIGALGSIHPVVGIIGIALSVINEYTGGKINKTVFNATMLSVHLQLVPYEVEYRAKAKLIKSTIDTLKYVPCPNNVFLW